MSVVQVYEGSEEEGLPPLRSESQRPPHLFLPTRLGFSSIALLAVRGLRKSPGHLCSAVLLSQCQQFFLRSAKIPPAARPVPSQETLCPGFILTTWLASSSFCTGNGCRGKGGGCGEHATLRRFSVSGRGHSAEWICGERGVPPR